LVLVYVDEWLRGVAECDGCGAEGPVTGRFSAPQTDDERLALAAQLWNRRAQTPVLVDDFRQLTTA
jgi:hypothetical protein